MKYNILHFNTFLLTFFAYSCFHATRKTFSNVKSVMISQWTPQLYNDSLMNDSLYHSYPDSRWNAHQSFLSFNAAEQYAGTLDTLFLCFYSLGLYISGALGDRFDLRLVLTLGMMTSGACVLLFGTASYFFDIYHPAWYGLWWSLCGLLQSSGWPTVVAVMGHWFGRGNRGLILGVWSSCASVGNILGSLLVARFVDYGFQVAFAVSGSLLFAGAVIVFFGLFPTPAHAGLVESDDRSDEQRSLLKSEMDAPNDMAQSPRPRQSTANGASIPNLASSFSQQSVQYASAPEVVVVDKEQPIGFLRAIMLPGVIPYALAYACLKLVNYSFFFWLPFYLNNRFGWSESVADELSSWYDVGGIISVIGAGLLSDWLGARGVICAVMLAASLPSLYVYSLSGANTLENSLLMGNIGFWIGGVANMVSSAISADLGRQDALKGNNKALATVTGIVDGTGSVGAALGQILLPYVQNNFGWVWVFYMFIVFAALTIVCITPIVWQEIRAFYVNGCPRLKRR